MRNLPDIFQRPARFTEFCAGVCGNGETPLQGLGRYISWFKRMTTNEYIRMVKEKILPPFYGKIWQRNYHEHIIRNEKSYNIIAEYINTNPQNWESDSLYQKP